MADSEYLWQITTAVTQALNADLLLLGRNPNNPVITAQNLAASFGLATNVKMFGALGAGTDDTSAIAAAIAATAPGGYLYFPPGTYQTQQTTINVLGLTVVLAQGATLQTVTAAADFTALLNIAVNNVTITGRGTLDGNRAAQTHSNLNTVFVATGVSGFRMENVTVTGGVVYGLHAEDVSDINLDQVTFTNHVSAAIFIKANTANIKRVNTRNCVIDQTATGGVCINYNCNAAFKISGSEIVDNWCYTNGVVDSVHIFGDGENNKVARNYVEGGSIGISVANNGTSGNNFCPVECNNLVKQTSIAIELVGSAMLSAVDNTIDGQNVTPTGISLNGFNNAAYRFLSAANNKIRDCTTVGIHVYYASYSQLIGNGIDFGSGTGYAIELQASSYCSAIGNNLKGPVSIGSVAFYLADGSSHLDFGPNNCEGWGWMFQVANGIYDHISVSGGSWDNWVNGAYQLNGTPGGHITFKNITGYFFGGVDRADIEDAANFVYTAWGTGVPEGSLTGGVGSVLFQTDGAAGAQQWRKATGTGNTGWLLVAECLAAITASRPTLGTAHSGFMMLDTTLHKPIWWTGTGWVDATGIGA